MWKAKIKSKSSLDSSGFIDVIYDILIDDVVTYPSLEVTARADEVQLKITEKITDLYNEFLSSQQIQVGDEIVIGSNKDGQVITQMVSAQSISEALNGKINI